MRLIDSDKLEPHWIIRSDGTRVYAVHYEDIEQSQPLEVVPEVLCKECRHWSKKETQTGAIDIGYCWCWCGSCYGDEYCSRAERVSDDG